MPFDDGDSDGQLQYLIIMHGDVAKSNHITQRQSQRIGYPARLRQQGKYIARTLRHAQPFPLYQMLPHVQRRFTGALNIQNGRILAGQIAGECGRVPQVSFPRAHHAPTDTGRW